MREFTARESAAQRRGSRDQAGGAAGDGSGLWTQLPAALTPEEEAFASTVCVTGFSWAGEHGEDLPDRAVPAHHRPASAAAAMAAALAHGAPGEGGAAPSLDALRLEAERRHHHRELTDNLELL